jgi:hypothetical protein
MFETAGITTKRIEWSTQTNDKLHPFGAHDHNCPVFPICLGEVIF